MTISIAKTKNREGSNLVLRHTQMRVLYGDSIRDEIGVARSHEVFETLLPPAASSTLAPNHAFGGLSTAMCVQAGFHSLYGGGNGNLKKTVEKTPSYSTDWYLFTLSGTFLGPLTVTSNVRLAVETVRNTRNFQTRLIRIFQPEKVKIKQGDTQQTSSIRWSPRLLAIVDFVNNIKHAKNPLTGYSFNFTEQPRQRDVLKDDPSTLLTPLDVIEVKRKEKDPIFSSFFAKYYAGLYDVHLQTVDGRFRNMNEIETLGSVFKLSADSIRKIKEREGTTSKDQSQHTESVWLRPQPGEWTVAQIAEQMNQVRETDVLRIHPRSLSATLITSNSDPRTVAVMWTIHPMMYGRDQLSVTNDFSLRFHQPVDQVSIDEWLLYETVIDVEKHSFFAGYTKCFDRKGNKLVTLNQQCTMKTLSHPPASAAKPSSSEPKKKEAKL